MLVSAAPFMSLAGSCQVLPPIHWRGALQCVCKKCYVRGARGTNAAVNDSIVVPSRTQIKCAAHTHAHMPPAAKSSLYAVTAPHSTDTVKFSISCMQRRGRHHNFSYSQRGKNIYTYKKRTLYLDFSISRSTAAEASYCKTR